MARLQIDQVGNGLVLSLSTPSTQTTRDRLCAEDGARVVSIIAQTPGVYTIQIRGRLAPGYSSAFGIKWIERRIAMRADRDRIKAEALFDDAEFLRTAGRGTDSRHAIARYSEAGRLFSAVGAASEGAVARLRMGELYLLLGDSANASKSYGQVLAESAKLADSWLQAAALNGMAAVRIVTGETAAAFDNCSRALSVAKASGDRRGMAQALHNLGDYYGWSSEYQKSSDNYQQALALREQLHDYRGQAQTVLTLGYNASDSEDNSRARACYERSRTLFQAVGDRRGLARVAAAIAQIDCKTGRYWEAMESYASKKEWFESLDEFEVSGRMHNNMGVVYSRMGLFENALEHYRKALALFESARYQHVQANTHNLLGLTLLALERPREAAAHQQSAVELFQKVHDPRMEAISLCYLGDAYSEIGELATARGLYERALEIFVNRLYLRGEANAYFSLGRIQQKMASPEEALLNHRKALNIYRQIQDRSSEFQTLHFMAQAERDLGNWDEARSRIEEAMAVAESLRASVPSPDMRSYFFATTQQSHELYVDIMMQIHAKQPARHLAAAALYASERARARSLLELLAESGSSIGKDEDSELLTREQELRRLMSSKADRRTQLLSNPHTEAGARALEAEIHSLDREYDELQAQIRIRNPRYASVTQVQPLTSEQVQQHVLDEDTLLLEYALGEKRSYLWLVGKQSLQSFELPPRETIEKLAGRVRAHLIARQTRIEGETALHRNSRIRAADGDYRIEAAKLSRILLGPAASMLGSKRLVFVPDGTLQYLSLGALPSPSASDISEGRGHMGEAPPLIAGHEIVVLPSASALSILREQMGQRRPAARSVAVFADPIFEALPARKPAPAVSRQSAAGIRAFQPEMRDGVHLVRLLSARQEADAIMASVPPGSAMLATGFSATRERVLSPDLKEYRIIHFATHGLADDVNPRMSWIALSTVDPEGKPRNGFLRLLDIYNMSLSADLVVLSACSTALGKNIRGEGIVGLVRGFLYAGAARVVASLWRVDDQSTAELMKRFYRAMLKENLSPAAALRTAQLEMSHHERWSAPYYWAGFVLLGEYK